MNNYGKRILQNIAIVFLMIIGVKNIIFALPFPMKFSDRFYYLYTTRINPNMVVIPGVLSFITGTLMLLSAYRLYRRVKMAWILEMIVLTISIVLQIIKWHTFTAPIIMLELYVWIILMLSYKDYSRKSNSITVKWALICALISLSLVLTNATVGLFLIRSHLKGVYDIIDSFMYTVSLLFLMDTSVYATTSKLGTVYVHSLMYLNWICIVFSALFILKPLVIKRSTAQTDKEKTRSLVLAHGQNPMSYLALENDKKYFFGSKVDGVAAYTVVGNVFVCCGDMVCAKEDSEIFLNELMAYCNQNDWNILFLNVTDYLMDSYKKANFGFVKYGEDACFKLSDYTLAGGKIAKVRTAVNRANKEGITVHEYKPVSQYDAQLEKELNAISEEWLEGKKMSEMGFMLGGLGLSDPMDRRYFYANDVNGRTIGFVVFTPYLQKTAYLADVTRYRKDAPVGVLEKIIFESFMTMKSEGIQWGSMGLSPLCNVDENDKATITEKLFAFVYEHLNHAYGFKTLHKAKEKYAPTQWQSRFIAFNPKPFSPQFAYAIVKAQNPSGISSVVLSQLTKKKKQNHFQEGYIRSSSADIFYRSYGTEQPMILLHGNNQNSDFFQRQINFFKKYYRVITIDSRGHGKSTYGQKRLSIPVMADDVYVVMEKLGLKKVFLLGFSDGGNVALQLALSESSSENIKALVIVSANLYPAGIKSFIRIPIKWAYFICRIFSKMSWFDKKAQMLSLMANEPHTNPMVLCDIKVPTLVLAGEHDVINQAHTELIYESIPAAKLKIIGHGNHLLLANRYKEVNQIIFEFLNNVK